MRSFLRHVLSILLLPFTVVFVVPWSLLGAGAARPAATFGAIRAWHVAGALVFLAGLALFGWCVALFARVGRGTLAPWDPTRRLVAVGPYRYVRNPMITAVAVMLVGESLFFLSGVLAGWAVLFIAVNHLYFVFFEEPGLERRFGGAYAEYRARVPRWLPRGPF